MDTNVATATATMARLRNEPVQARSAARLDTLLDAAATVLDEVGYERLTTALIAQRASASIGTVYRYFPDRLAVLEGLAVRAGERLLVQVRSALEGAGDDRSERLGAVLDVLVDAHRTDTGFRVVCVFQAMSVLGPREEETHGPDIVSPLLAEISGGGTADATTATALFVGEALIHRAFTTNRDGDEELLAEARRVALLFLDQS